MFGTLLFIIHNNSLFSSYQATDLQQRDSVSEARARHEFVGVAVAQLVEELGGVTL